MIKGARNDASWVLGVFKSRSIPIVTQLYKSLIRSRVEYCWNPLKVANIQMIEDIQRQFTRRISGLHGMDYWERLTKLILLEHYNDDGSDT